MSSERHDNEDELTAVSAAHAYGDVPKTLKDAMKSPFWPWWKRAMERELASLERHDVCVEVDECESYFSPLSTRWVFSLKPDKFKARLVVRGYEQDDADVLTFSPTLSFDVMRMFFVHAVQRGYDTRQYDVETAFLNSPLHTPVYVRMPPGFGKAGKCWKLQRALYGLSNAPRAWHVHCDAKLRELGYIPSLVKPCLYVHPSNGTVVARFVDDMRVAGTEEAMNAFERDFGSVFRIERRYGCFLGLDITYSDGILRISLSSYIDKLAARFGLASTKPVSTPLPLRVDLSIDMDQPASDQATLFRPGNTFVL